MLKDILQAQVNQQPEAVAVRIKIDGRYHRWSRRELWTNALAVAGAIRDHGVGPGRRVALYAENSPQWIFAYLGIYLAGGVVIPLDAQYSERELDTILNFAECSIMLCSRAKREIAEKIGAIRTILEIDADSELYHSPPMEEPASRPSDDLMALIFTSGTTGDPKGVRLSVGNITSNIQSALKLNLIRDDDIFLSLLPLHHCYALTVSVLIPLASGCPITICTSLRGPDIIDAMRETGVSILLGVPKLFEGFDRAILDKISALPAWKRRMVMRLMRVSRWVRLKTNRYVGKYVFRSIHRTFGPRFRFFVSGGAKLDSAVVDRFLDMGIILVEGYGLTEAAPVVSFNPADRPKPGTVGFALPDIELAIDQPDTEGIGEVKIRGPNVMQGYERRPEETAEVLRDGWLYTGDLGFIDSEGYLRLTGRAKEVIVMASGKNIYPEDVERYYEQSPLVREICVMPIELPGGRVEKLQAVVVPDFDELRRIRATGLVEAIRHEMVRMAQALPSYMHITDLKIVTNEFPRTRLGKLKRAEIRRMVFDEVDESETVAMSPEDQALLDQPGALSLIERIKTIGRIEIEVLPGDHLEFDLGLDSLARIELDVVLEREFGIKILPEEIASVTTVRDLLKRLSPEAVTEQTRQGWDVILRQRVSPPISEMFNLNRGPLRRGFLNVLRRSAGSLSQRFFPFDIQGLENLPDDRPYLLCPTHASRIDAVLIYMALPESQIEKMFFLGAADYFESFIMKKLGRAGRVIPTATTDTLLGSLRRAAEVLFMGRNVCIFPEGYITRNGCLQPPRPGAAILACQMGVPIVPVLMRGTYDLLSYANPGFRFRPVGLTVGRAIDPPVKEKYDNADYAQLMARWQEAIVRMRREDDASLSATAGRSPRIGDDMNTRE